MHKSVSAGLRVPRIRFSYFVGVIWCRVVLFTVDV